MMPHIIMPSVMLFGATHTPQVTNSLKHAELSSLVAALAGANEHSPSSDANTRGLLLGVHGCVVLTICVLAAARYLLNEVLSTACI